MISFLLITGFVISYFFSWLFVPMSGVLFLYLALLLSDVILLNRQRKAMTALRLPKYKRLSNGDENELWLRVISYYGFKTQVAVIDELPFQFQERNFLIQSEFNPGEEKEFVYKLRPTERGEYHFGSIQVFVKSVLGLVERQISMQEPFMMECYPSFIRLRQFELMAIHNRLNELGIKRIRRIGVSNEFEQIKDYVSGDDVRKINWKATARSNKLMLNHYRDERSQHVYCLLDMGRVMKMPFEGLKLIDYAINASLVISHVAWNKEDKPGVIGFSDNVNFKIKSDNKGNQLLRIQEALYNANTGFAESSYENLFSHVRRQITQRSLLLLFTNFETLNALKRQMKYLKAMASNHLLVVIFFENTELKDLLSRRAESTFEIYEQTIAQKFDYEKRLITHELQKYGILSLYTPPEKLTINALNKYLEIKTRGLI